MQLEAINLATISAAFQVCAQELMKTDPDSQLRQQDPAQTPAPLIEAMQRVMDLLRLLAEGQTDSLVSNPGKVDDDTADIHRLGDYGINLLADLSSLAGALQQDHLSHELEGLCLPFAVWIARQGGELSTLEPVVNALANQANSLKQPAELGQLYAVSDEIQRAVTPALQHDLEKSNPNRAWRILLLNKAIIATRSHRLELMETAYENLVKHLPEEAAQFFRAGMQQMVALDYPQSVRNVVEKYYNQWSVAHTLH